MSPIVQVFLILASLIAAVVWVAIYFFLIEAWLKKQVGSIFSVTIGRTKLMERRHNAKTSFYVSGWRVAEPQSTGCLFDMFIWVIGGVLRLLFIGVPASALLATALYLAYRVTRP